MELFMSQLKGKDSLLTGISFSLLSLLGIIMIDVACQDPSRGKLISDQSFGKIIYDTYIVNRDTTDTWGSECLSNFNRTALIEKVFKSVADGKITPLDYFTGEKVSHELITKMETDGEFSRKNISKIQFEERWIWDNEKVEMQKQLLSMTIAYDVFDNTGKPRGQKPVFKLVFRK
jgi:hypothetical protein